MKYLKTFEMINDSTWDKLDKIVSDIKDFSHILEDEGFDINIDVISDGVLNINLISNDKYKVIFDSDTRIGRFNVRYTPPRKNENPPDLTPVTEMPEVKEYMSRVMGLFEDRDFKGACFVYLKKDAPSYAGYQLFHIIATHGKYMRRGKCQLYGSDLKMIESVKTEGTTDEWIKLMDDMYNYAKEISYILEDEEFIFLCEKDIVKTGINLFIGFPKANWQVDNNLFDYISEFRDRFLSEFPGSVASYEGMVSVEVKLGSSLTSSNKSSVLNRAIENYHQKNNITGLARKTICGVDFLQLNFSVKWKKFTSAKNESVDERHTQNKIISEISCIRHILEDEKFKMNINTSSPNFIGISVMIQNEFGPSYIDITGDQSVEEFDERLQEVCALNGYVCKKLNNTLISGYVVWHCWDSTKMDRSAFTYE